MSKNMKWKNKLLSSSVPLEYEIAKILASNGFFIDADFPFTRNDGNEKKYCSVDIRASAYPPFYDDNEIKAEMDLLIECKYRNPETKWLFLPDVNRPEYSNITLGRTIQVYYQFSPYHIKTDSTHIEERYPLSYKAIEIKTKDGDVYDSEIKHGISQLRYALPYLVKRHIETNLYSHGEDNVPFFICPIMLTTAELILAHKKISINNVKNLSSFEKIGKKVPYIILYSENSDDFINHCTDIFSPLSKLKNNDNLRQLDNMRKKSSIKEYEFYYPKEYLDEIINNRYFSSTKFKQFIICNVESFPILLKDMKKIITDCLRTRKSFK